MTKFLVILFFVSLSPIYSLQAQNTSMPQIDVRFRAVFDENYLQSIATDTFWLMKWTFYLDNAFFISDKSLDKAGNEDIAGTIEVPDLKNINILALEKTYALKRDYYTYKAYKIKNTSQYLVYFPTRDYIEKLRNRISDNRQ